MTVSGAEPLHLAPFHMSRPIAPLDWVSSGRAGAAVKVSACEDESGHFGRRALPAGPQLAEERNRRSGIDAAEGGVP